MQLLSHISFYRLVAEFPATGGILTSWQFYSVKLLRYVSNYDYFIASCEITFCIFLIVFTTQEIQKMREFKSAYFQSIWNWLELLLLVVSIYSRIWLKGLTPEPTNEGGVKRRIRVPFVAQWKQIQLGTMRLQVRSLAVLSGLRIRCCCESHELRFRSQTRLRSHVAGVGWRLWL